MSVSGERILFPNVFNLLGVEYCDYILWCGILSKGEQESTILQRVE